MTYERRQQRHFILSLHFVWFQAWIYHHVQNDKYSFVYIGNKKN